MEKAADVSVPSACRCIADVDVQECYYEWSGDTALAARRHGQRTTTGSEWPLP